MKRAIETSFFSELATCINKLHSLRYLLSSLMLLFIAFSINAQDIIIKKDGSEIEAKVLEIKSTIIRYNKFEMQDGPAYEIAKSEVFMIKYPNGQKDIFNKTTDVTTQTNKSKKSPAHEKANKKNAVGLNPIMLLIDIDSKVGFLEYERLIGNKFSIGGRIIRIEHYEYRYEESSTGIGFFARKYFNRGSGLKGFFIGSTVDIVGVKWNESWRQSEWNPYSGNYEYHTKYEYGSGMAIAVTAQFGYKFNIIDRFYIEPSASVGFYNSHTSSNLDSYDETGFIAVPALTFGVKF